MSVSKRYLHRRNRYRGPTLLLISSILVSWIAGEAAQTAGATSSSFQPTFETVACPPEIVYDKASTISCGYLTVLEDRADPNGRTIRLFVLMAEPLKGDTAPDPIFIPGRDLVGMSPPFVPFGYGVGRVRITMDRSGAGRSEPSLACPEVRRLTDAGTGILLGSDEMRTALLDAVQACHDRGIGPFPRSVPSTAGRGRSGPHRVVARDPQLLCDLAPGQDVEHRHHANRSRRRVDDRIGQPRGRRRTLMVLGSPLERIDPLGEFRPVVRAGPVVTVHLSHPVAAGVIGVRPVRST